jgi:hypothetical protein
MFESEILLMDNTMDIFKGSATYQAWQTLKAHCTQPTAHNSQSTRCHCGNQSVVHFCQQCLKSHDEYCKIPF